MPPKFVWNSSKDIVLYAIIIAFCNCAVHDDDVDAAPPHIISSDLKRKNCLLRCGGTDMIVAAIKPTEDRMPRIKRKDKGIAIVLLICTVYYGANIKCHTD